MSCRSTNRSFPTNNRQATAAPPLPKWPCKRKMQAEPCSTRVHLGKRNSDRVPEVLGYRAFSLWVSSWRMQCLLKFWWSGAPYSHVADKKGGPLCTQDQKIDRQNHQSLGSPAPTLPPWYPLHPSPRICFKAIPEGPHIQPLGNWDHNSFYSMVFWGLIP